MNRSNRSNRKHMLRLFSRGMLLTAAALTAVPAHALPYHDADYDADIDLLDYADFQASLGSTAAGALALHDFDDDGDIDGADFANLEAAYTEALLGPLPDGGPEAAGAPRTWQASIALNPFSIYNAANGNVFTRVPLAALEPGGFPVDISLYHNSALALAGETACAFYDSQLPVGWSTSFSGRIEADEGGRFWAIEDDGTRNLFVLADGETEAVGPAGVHDRLVAARDPNGVIAGWELIRASQARRAFDADGALLSVTDPYGKQLVLERDGNGAVTKFLLPAVAQQQSVMQVSFGNRNETISGVQVTGVEIAIPGFAIDERPIINTAYSGLLAIRTEDWRDDSYFEFDSAGRITSASSVHNLTWHYVYSEDGRLTEVIDPAPNTTFDMTELFPTMAPPAVGQRVTQTFSTLDAVLSDCVWRRDYVDRRGETWHYDFAHSPDGLVYARLVDPLDHAVSRVFDPDLNLAAFTNGLGHTWHYDYGPVGNLVLLTSPLDSGDPNAPTQTWTFDWEAVGSTPTNFYRLTRATDPAGHWREYEYDDTPTADPNGTDSYTHPRLIAAIVEGPAEPGGATATTTRTYHGKLHMRGRIKKVTDANAVSTVYRYDRWGYPAGEDQGFFPPQPPQSVSVQMPRSTGTMQNSRYGVPQRGIDFFGHQGDTNYSKDGLPLHIDCDHECTEDPNGGPSGDVSAGGGSGTDGAWQPTDRIHPTIPPGSGFTSSTNALSGIPLPHVVESAFCELGVTLNGDRQVAEATSCYPVPINDNYWNDGSTTELPRELVSTFEYDGLKRLTTVNEDYLVAAGGYDATITIDQFDAEDRPLQMTLQTGEVLSFTYDAAGRLASIARNGMSETYYHDAAGQRYRIDYGNGAQSLREFDGAGRVTSIEHKYGGASLLTIEYTWSINNWIVQRREITPARTATVDFEYDNRGRLTRETRAVDTTVQHDVAYAYDQLGNRTRGDDLLTGDYTLYHYDTDAGFPGIEMPPAPGDDPNDTVFFVTRNNRLQRYEIYEQTDPNTHTLRRSVHYAYYVSGDVANITVIDEVVDELGDQWAHDLAFYYTRNGVVRAGLLSRWKLDQFGQTIPASVEALAAREFFFDSPQQRALTIDYETPSVDPATWTFATAARTTYAAGMRVGDQFDDLTDADPNMHYERTYFADTGEQEASSERYWHADMVGSIMLTSDETGAAAERAAYTAFGATVDPNTGALGGDPHAGLPRFQYAGGAHYESGLLAISGADPTLPTIRLQQVGFRWYQPDIGRFVQSDPLGIRGGLNTYLYAGARPTTGVDPTGLMHIWPFSGPELEEIDYWTRMMEEDWEYGNKRRYGRSSRMRDAAFGRYWHRLWWARFTVICTGISIGYPLGRWIDEQTGLSNLIGQLIHDVCPGCDDPSDGDPFPRPTLSCFVAGTLVHTAAGLVPIEQVSPGDRVLTQGLASGALAYREVTIASPSGHVRTTLRLCVGTDELESTLDHPYWVRHRGWVEAAALRAGDEVSGADGKWLPVRSTEVIEHDRPIPVYDIRVEGIHWFFVGWLGVLVHNT